MKNVQFWSVLSAYVISFFCVSICTELNEKEKTNSTVSVYLNNSNNNEGDRLIINSYIYEVGIITNDDNDTDDSNDTTIEQSEFSFFGSLPNGTLNISSTQPANISGQFSSITLPLSPITAFIISALPNDDENATNNSVPPAILTMLQDFNSNGFDRNNEDLKNLTIISETHNSFNQSINDQQDETNKTREGTTNDKVKLTKKS